jgi:hypothetical protein
MKQSDCTGCRENFYNGNNDLGVTRCWNFESASLILRKEVHINQVPPWTQEPIMKPSCYRRTGYIYVKPTQTY